MNKKEERQRNKCKECGVYKELHDKMNHKFKEEKQWQDQKYQY